MTFPKSLQFLSRVGLEVLRSKSGLHLPREKALLKKALLELLEHIQRHTRSNGSRQNFLGGSARADWLRLRRFLELAAI
jgi:hypothetical protein